MTAEFIAKQPNNHMFLINRAIYLIESYIYRIPAAFAVEM